MLSNPPTVLQQRQRLHRRQNSTPVTYEAAMKVPNMLAPGLSRQNSLHRRGQSLDQRSPIRRPRSQAESVSIISNKGSNTTIEQQILREAQQQKIARPGQRYHEPQQSPQCGGLYDPSNYQSMQHMSMNNGMFCNQETLNALLQTSGNTPYGDSQELMPHGMPEYPVSAESYDGIGLGLDENAGHHYFQQSHRVTYNMPAENQQDMRRMSQPDLQRYGQRPVTPTQQTNLARFPLTPATTPFKRTTLHAQYAKTAQSSPTKEWADETIKASHQVPMHRGRSLQSIFEGQASHCDLPSPPGTAPLASSSTFDIALMPTPGLGDLDDMDNNPFEDDLKKPSQRSPITMSPAATSYNSTPEMTQSSNFEDNGRVGRPRSQLHMLPSSQTMPDLSCSSSPTRAGLSPRRMSISDLNLEPGINASIEETSVTLDDIAQFIEGPHPEDNKWICKYDDCNKRFGRKENIKSHVQTHLGDRQFRCDHCNKCFVRGHDLKRHAKIHSGAKPYPCLCGNAFARHDALTRHRQRGMCIGAFDGVVKKVIKRGRPRKHRPEMDERMDKASRSRQLADDKDRLNHYATSSSGSSVYSYQSPPTETFENLSIRGSSPFDDMAFFSSQPQPGDLMSLPPDMFTFTPPSSPGYSTGRKPSPSHRSVTPTDLASIPEMPPSSPSMHHHNTNHLVSGMVAAHHHHSPPSLCNSSSSPVPEPATIYDFDAMLGSQQTTNNAGGGGGDPMGLKMEMDRTDFESFFDYGDVVNDQDDFFAQL